MASATLEVLARVNDERTTVARHRIRWMLSNMRESGLHGWQPGISLASDPVTIIYVEAESCDEALEKAWAVGNRMAADADGFEWSSEVRSISVGDVAVTDGKSYAVRGVGFERVDIDEVYKVHKTGREALCSVGGSW